VIRPERRLSRAAALRAFGPVVYAVRLPDGIVKIGHTTNLARRLNRLQAEEVLAFKPGTYEDEQAIHDRLVEHVAHGREYYRPVPAVIAVVNELRAHFGMEPIAA